MRGRRRARLCCFTPPPTLRRNVTTARLKRRAPQRRANPHGRAPPTSGWTNRSAIAARSLDKPHEFQIYLQTPGAPRTAPPDSKRRHEEPHPRKHHIVETPCAPGVAAAQAPQRPKIVPRRPQNAQGAPRQPHLRSVTGEPFRTLRAFQCPLVPSRMSQEAPEGYLAFPWRHF